MKEEILHKIALAHVKYACYNHSVMESYNDMLKCSTRCFDELVAIYGLSREEENFIWEESLKFEA
jgi:hypothetical protein